MVTAAVLKRYEDMPATFKWMIAFIPLVLACGGNVGAQSATLVIRAMALEKLSGSENMRMIRREVLLAGLLGGTLAAFSFLFAWLAFGHNPAESAVVSLSVLLVVLTGTVAGALLPISFKRIGMDPALMSNPLLAALVDVVGVLGAHL